MRSAGTLGTFGGSTRARYGIDGYGGVEHGSLTITWWVGADDGWHDPAHNPTTRVRRPGVAPSYETAVRVPAGDFVQRAYAVATPSGTGAIAIDFENASRAPCSVAIVVAVDSVGQARLEGNALLFDGTRVWTFARPPRLWASGPNLQVVVWSGGAAASSPPVWNGPTQFALLAPVPHGTVLRTALTTDEVDARALATPSDVERAWNRHLDRGLRTELPEPLQADVDAQRADLLLAPSSAEVVAALEDWGFDAEAAAAWLHLGVRARWSARRRRDVPATSHAAVSSDAFERAASFLLAVRRLLVRERRNRVELLPGFRPEWLGQNLAAHDVPLRRGSVSFALRWHAARPALLWEAPPGLALRAPALDPAWSSNRQTGEALLATPPAPLLAMGSSRREGERIADPESFG